MSGLFAPVETSPELLARLHLFAVLPAFPDLLKHSAQARKRLGKQRFRLRLQSPAKLQADLFFSRGRCRFLGNTPGRPGICLRFVSHQQLNRQFTGDGFSLPIPTGGLCKIRALWTFSRLSAQLQAALVEPTDTTTEPEALHLRLNLGIALAAACQLITHEAFCAHLFAGESDWAVEFTIGETDFRAWIGGRAGATHWGRGRSQNPLARLHFENPRIAQEALNGRLDNMRAVAGGAIRISGLTPLVDRLSLVLERVPLYLPPPTAS